MLGGNSDVYLEALLAITDAGAIACPLNTRWSASEVAAALQVLAPHLAVVDAAHAPLYQDASASVGSSNAPPRCRLLLLDGFEPAVRVAPAYDLARCLLSQLMMAAMQERPAPAPAR